MNHDKKETIIHSQYKSEVVGLIRDGGQAISAVVRDLGLTESAVRRWVVASDADAGRGNAKVLTAAEREELVRLRRDNRQLRTEREIVKKATAFFAKEST